MIIQANDQTCEIYNEKHYTPQEIARIYNVKPRTVYRWFKDDPEVIEYGSDETVFKRKKKYIRIPERVLRRWHETHRRKS